MTTGDALIQAVGPIAMLIPIVVFWAIALVSSPSGREWLAARRRARRINREAAFAMDHDPCEVVL